MMETLGFIFGIFGLFAYLELSRVKKRLTELERQLAQMGGTSYARDRAALAKLAQSYMGQSVRIELKEDHEDAEILSAGSMGFGRLVLVDADEDWLRIRVESAGKSKEKLIRLESVQNISVKV